MAPPWTACRPHVLRTAWSLSVLWALLTPQSILLAQDVEAETPAVGSDSAEEDGAAMLLPHIPVDTPYLRIEWPAFLVPEKDSSDDAQSPNDIVAKACKNLGSAMLVGRGSWGLGLFSNFGCYLEKQSGASSKPFAGTLSKAETQWTLRFIKEGDELQIAVYYEAPDHKDGKVRVAKVVSTANPWTQDLLRDPKYASLVAALVLDAMPAIRRFEPLSDPQTKTLDVPLDTGKPPRQRSLRPKALTLFTWSFNPNTRLWMPHIIGSATIIGKKPKLSWHLTFVESPGTKPIFAQSIEGPGTRQIPGAKLLAVHEKTLLTNEDAPGYERIRDGVSSAARFVILNTVESGYIGVRVGRELIDPATAIIPPATIISVLGEIRSGYAAGLRVYLDVVPRRQSTQNNEPLWIGYNRIVAGYNFGLNVDYLVDRLELAPKIGAWNVNSRLAEFGTSDTEPVVYRAFNLNFALSLGFEAGAVWEGRKYLLRLWHGRDLSNPFLKVAGVKRKVLSSRTGIDGMFKGPPVHVFGKKWHLSYLIFAYYESLTFTQESTEAGNFQLEFSSPYAGGGLSLAW